MLQTYRLNNKIPEEVTDVLEWVTWFANNKDQTIVQKTKIHNISISTVFLGMDHADLGASSPLLFETMIMGEGFNEISGRYSTWEEAEQGHNKTCALIQQKVFN